MTELAVRTSLTHQHKTKFLQNSDNFARLQNRDVTHKLSHAHTDCLCPDKLCFEMRIAIFKEHRNDLL